MEKFEKILNYIFAVLQWSNLVVVIIACIFVFCGYDYSIYKILNSLVSSFICFLIRFFMPFVFDKIYDYFNNSK